MIKKALAVLFLVTLLAGMVEAQDLAGKVGIGLRADTFSIRKFVSNNLGLDVFAGYVGSTRTGQTDANMLGYGLGGFYANEIYKDVLLEAGAVLHGWQGIDGTTGNSYTGAAIIPFIGAECFINSHFSLDGQVELGAYGCTMMGNTRSTSLNVLTGSLGAHIYF
ncbi:MAG: hypothetical protein NT099_02070 [Candidatus Saganbacteria bacterium]|nr:hypothetical protein [Candidatus Saganbacteria bacterium]